jgi:mycothiol system anti-sigma-R factor
MECEEVVFRLWEYLDQELGQEEAEAVAAHLNHCPWCHPVYCCDRAFLALLARQRAGCSAPPNLIMWVRDRFRLQ